jgi:hypothetical protein
VQLEALQLTLIKFELTAPFGAGAGVLTHDPEALVTMTAAPDLPADE